MKQRFALYIILIAASLAAVVYARRPLDLTDSQILQQMIDSAYSSEGGTVDVGHKHWNLGTAPIRLLGAIHFKGDVARNTNIEYHGAGYAIRLAMPKGNNTYHQTSTIQDVTLTSDAGGIGFDDSAADNESARIAIRDSVIIANKGIGVDLRHKNGQANYNLAIDDTDIRVHPSYPALSAFNRVSRISGLRVFTLRDATATDARPAAGVILEGFNRIDSSQIEGEWGSPAIKASGSITIEGTWIESKGGELFDNCTASVDQTTWFVQPKEPCRLINGSNLSVTSPLNFTDDAGGKKTTWDKCFIVDRTSSLTAVGRVYASSQ